MESPLHGTVLGSCRFVKYAVCKDYRTGISDTSELLIIPKDVDVLPDDLRKALVDDLNIIKMSNGASYDINLIDKLYIHNTAKVPRYKLKDIKEKNNVSVVRSFTAADHIVINKEEIANCILPRYRDSLYKRADALAVLKDFTQHAKYNDFIEQMKKLYYYKFSRLSTELILNLVRDLEALSDEYEYLMTDWTMARLLKDIEESLQAQNFKTLPLTPSFTFMKSPVSIAQEDLQFILSIKDKIVLDDSVIQQQLGESVLTLSDYEFISGLLKNAQSENVEVGLTLMANSNFAKSAHYLLLLLIENYDTVRHNKYTKSVSFRSMLSYLQHKGYDTLDTVIEKAVANGGLTDDFREFLINRYMKKMEGQSFSRYLTVTKVDLIIPESIEKQQSYE